MPRCFAAWHSRNRNAAETGELGSHARLAYLLYRWRDFTEGGGGEVRRWTDEQLARTRWSCNSQERSPPTVEVKARAILWLNGQRLRMSATWKVSSTKIASARALRIGVKRLCRSERCDHQRVPGRLAALRSKPALLEGPRPMVYYVAPLRPARPVESPSWAAAVPARPSASNIQRPADISFRAISALAMPWRCRAESFAPVKWQRGADGLTAR